MSMLIKWPGWGIGSKWSSLLDDDFVKDWPQLSDNSGIDIYETDDAVVVEAQVPGVSEKNVEVLIEGNVLIISAEEKETEEEKKSKKTVYKSTRQTCFHYSTNIPRMVDASKADAEVKNGVVKVTIPKSESEKPKKVVVKKKD